jgi:competence protein ComEC
MYRKGDLRSAITRAPMVRMVVPFVVGLVLGGYAIPPLSLAWALTVACLAAWVYFAYAKHRYAFRWTTGSSLMLALLSFGILWQRLHTTGERGDHVSALAAVATGWEVKVLEVASMNDRTERAWAEVRSAVVNDSVIPASGRMLLTLMKDSTRADPAVGDRVLVNGVAEPIDRRPDPGGFDLQQWAASHGVEHECFAPGDHWRTVASANGLDALFEGTRDRIGQWLRDSGLPDRERALVKAVLLGLRDDLERDQTTAFVRSGTIHVLAVSGSHVAIIYAAIVFGLAFLGKRKGVRLLRGCIALSALWLYAGLTGFTPSVMRATVMFSFFTVAEMTNWRVDPVNSLAASALLLLLWDPSVLLQAGFQLSYLAVLGILVFYRPIVQAWAPPNAVTRFFWSLLAVSLAAQAFTLPLCLYMFHAFPIWFLPANMVIVGLVTIAVYGGMALVAFHAVPVLGPALSLLMKWLLIVLGWSSFFFAGLPGAYPSVRIGPWGMLGLYVLLALLTTWVLLRRQWARSATMATGMILLCAWGWTAHQRNTQRQLVLYDDRNVLACGIVQGRTLMVFADSTTEWTERKVSAHARNAGVDRVVRVDSLPRRMEWQGGSYAFVPVGRSGSIPASTDSARTIVLHGNGWLDPDALEQCVADTSTTWVLASDLGSYPRRKMAELCEAAHRPVYVMRDAGAYVRPR